MIRWQAKRAVKTRMWLPAIGAVLFGVVATGAARRVAAPAAESEWLVDRALHHLGDDETPDWTDVPKAPEGASLTLTFAARARAEESLLSLVQQDINHAWIIELNGTRVGELRQLAARSQELYAVPGGVLRDGENQLRLAADRAGDDVILGDIRILGTTLREHFRLGRLHVRVRDQDGSAGLPARVTITRAGGPPPQLFYGDDTVALRPGVAYTQSGELFVELPAGEYDVAAARGPEWSIDRSPARIDFDGETSVGLSLRHEVDTTGFVAADTHIHTLEHSGHGDASERERLITLAGEGVELAIATDHNHNIDYRPLQQRMRLQGAFTAVVGNEVTTPIGHFNAFPLDPADAVPPHDLHDWVQIVTGMREHGARVIILNHPRWPKIETGPLGTYHLDRDSGEREGPAQLGVTGIEVINSGCLEPDPTFLLVDWFALLNRGERIIAVGTSDSHTVGDIVGQGRTYVPSATDDPARIDVDAACAAFVRGQVSVSLGMLVDIRVDGRATMGDTITPEADRVAVDLRVAAPSWVRPHTACVYQNGVLVAQQEVPHVAATPTDVRLRFDLAVPPADAHLVCAVIGDPVRDPAWPIPGEYTLGVTNPVWLDGDGDGECTSAFATASKLFAAHPQPADLREVLLQQDDAIAVQLASRMLASGDAAMRAVLAEIAPQVQSRPSLARYLARLSGDAGAR